MNATDKQYLNSQELAELLGVSVRTIVNLRRRRQIPYIQMGHIIRYGREAVEAAMKSHTVEAIRSRLEIDR
jgi:excisionase family DNA binding protein